MQSRECIGVSVGFARTMADLHIRGIFRQEKALISKTSTLLVGWSIVLKGIHDGLVVGVDRELTTI